MCVAMYQYTGDINQQGLSFGAGDTLRVFHTTEDGWWEGEKDGIRGWFPASYVHILEKPEPGDTEEPETSHLPEGWQCFSSPQGPKYYVNTSTNETTWEKPTGSTTSSSPAASPGLGPVSPPGKKITENGFHSVSSEEKTSLKKTNSNDLHQGTTPDVPAPKKSKLTTITTNCVTFPGSESTAEQSLLKPDEWSYCDHFWADKLDAHSKKATSGFNVLLAKQMKGQQMSREMAEFIRQRVKIEEEYAKSLSKLSQCPLALQEEGTLGESWAQVKISLSAEAEVHLKFAAKLSSEVEKPLFGYRENFGKEMRKKEHHIANHRKLLTTRYSSVQKARKVLAKRQRELEMKVKHNEIKPSNKAEEEIMKARMRSTQGGDDLKKCVDLYNQAQFRWFEEMVTSSLELERLEVERIEQIEQHLNRYTQLRHETDVLNQSTMEAVNQSLQKVDPNRDRELWVKDTRTGSVRPVDMDL